MKGKRSTFRFCSSNSRFAVSAAPRSHSARNEPPEARCDLRERAFAATRSRERTNWTAGSAGRGDSSRSWERSRLLVRLKQGSSPRRGVWSRREDTPRTPGRLDEMGRKRLLEVWSVWMYRKHRLSKSILLAFRRGISNGKWDKKNTLQRHKAHVSEVPLIAFQRLQGREICHSAIHSYPLRMTSVLV